MARTSTVDTQGLSEFFPVRNAPAPKRRVVVTVSDDAHRVLTQMSEDATGYAGHFVSLGAVVNSLIKHYQSFE